MITQRCSTVPFALLAFAALALAGCHRTDAPAQVAANLPSPTTVVDAAVAASSRSVTDYPIRFTDVSKAAGITWQYTNGATGKNYFVEQTGGGIALFDYDNDGRLDIFALQGGPVPGEADSAGKGFSKRSVLYHNNGNGTFTDVTTVSGLDGDLGYGQAVSVADYDNDGWPDLFVTTYGRNRLFHNNHNGTFTEVADRSGLQEAPPSAQEMGTWSTSAAWGDYDNDGYLDLYVCHYCRWSVAIDLNNGMRLQNRNQPAPVMFQGCISRLYHNNHNGTFADVTQRAGLDKLVGKSLSAAWIDYDGDGWQDLFVANDTTPDFLLHNNHNGTFTDQALKAGVALDSAGRATASMGIAVLDYRGEGRPDLVVTNFADEFKSVRHNLGNGLFEDGAAASKVTAMNRHYLGFGVDALDYDLDGYPDVVVGNGHVATDALSSGPTGATYAESQQLLHNQGDGTFVDDLRSLGDLVLPRVTRGLAVGDYDNDGDVDVLMVSQTGPLQLFRNDGNAGTNPHHWLTLRLEGVKSNRDAVGAKVTVRTQQGKRSLSQTQWVKGGSSYCAHSDLRLTFGLGNATEVTGIEILWPRGLRQTAGKLLGDRFYWLREGQAPLVDPRVHPPLVAGRK